MSEPTQSLFGVCPTHGQWRIITPSATICPRCRDEAQCACMNTEEHENLDCPPRGCNDA